MSNEIIRHNLLGRLNHFFDELVSQNIRDKLTTDYHARSRDIIALTNLKEVNNDLHKIWLRDIDHLSDFFLSIVREQVTKSKSKGPFDIYFVRTETSCYVLSNIGNAYSGELSVIDSDSAAFQPDSDEDAWVIKGVFLYD